MEAPIAAFRALLPASLPEKQKDQLNPKKRKDNVKLESN